MGTKSITRFYNEDGRLVLAFGRQFDGNIGEQGLDILNILVDKGIKPTLKRCKTRLNYRDIESAAADVFEQISKKYKGECAMSTEQANFVEYYYSIKHNDGDFYITITRRGKEIYSGLLADMPMEDEE